MENQITKKSKKTKKPKIYNKNVAKVTENIENEYSEESNSLDNTDNIQTDNNWSKFQLNNKLSSNISKIFPTPTNIQEKTLIYANSKVDLIIQARTGEGKTLCYAIPVLNYIFNFYERAPDMNKKISPVAIILVPTHELGVQVKNHMEMVIEQKNNNKKEDKKKFYYNIKIANVLGGFAKVKQLKILNKYNPEIIIATPGRLWEIIDNDEAPILENLKYLKFLIIDEADRMTQTGHFKELKNIIEHIYSRIEIKGRKVNKDENLMKEKLKKLGFDEAELDKELDEEENKKLAKTLNIDIDKIETIDPMKLMGDNPDFDTLDFKKNKMNDIDNIEQEEEEDENEDMEEIDENNDNQEIDNIEDIEQNNEEIEENEEQEENEEIINDDDDIEQEQEKKMTEEEKREIKKNLRNLRKDNIKEGEELIEYEKNVNLRTILCSAQWTLRFLPMPSTT